MHILGLIILSTFLVSAVSLIGITTLSLKTKNFNKMILILVALSAGALIGGAFLHLIPESLQFFKDETVFLYVLIGFGIFFLVEYFLSWRHCHDKECRIHTFAHMNIFGEIIHNIIDGLIIAAAFITSIPIGISTTIAVALHEIPQEFGDFGVLVHGGYKKKKAILINFLIGLTAIFGGIFGYFFSTLTNISLSILLPIAAGGFIYIAASDLIPEIRKDESVRKSTLPLLTFIIGIAIMYLLRLFI